MKRYLKIVCVFVAILLIAPSVVSSYPTKEEIFQSYGIPIKPFPQIKPVLCPTVSCPSCPECNCSSVINQTPCQQQTCPTCPTCPSCPTCNECPSVTGYTGTVHDRVYQVMVLDGIDQNLIKESIMYIPNVFGYEFVQEDPSKYYIDNDNNVVPKVANLIIIYDTVSRNATFVGSDGTRINKFRLAGKCGAGIFIGMDKSSDLDAMDISRLIFHECDHHLTAMVNIDQLSSFGSDYDSWKIHNGIDVMNKLLYAVYLYIENKEDTSQGTQINIITGK